MKTALLLITLALSPTAQAADKSKNSPLVKANAALEKVAENNFEAKAMLELDDDAYMKYVKLHPTAKSPHKWEALNSAHYARELIDNAGIYEETAMQKIFFRDHLAQEEAAMNAKIKRQALDKLLASLKVENDPRVQAAYSDLRQKMEKSLVSGDGDDARAAYDALNEFRGTRAVALWENAGKTMSGNELRHYAGQATSIFDEQFHSLATNFRDAYETSQREVELTDRLNFRRSNFLMEGGLEKLKPSQEGFAEIKKAAALKTKALKLLTVGVASLATLTAGAALAGENSSVLNSRNYSTKKPVASESSAETPTSLDAK